ncbi:MAG: heat-inducible transcriptional repressor HrcA [Oscillospiraceae bacterium]|nr:heat-inducible transcriptional repressor HrcA [Oscillospiraceae bacterium]
MIVELTQRRKAILAAIVEQYIRTGEPVGSKSLLETLPLPLSSATVRNEMAELSALGLLEQPHTSAGRIPSHAGYRYYVDHLMGQQALDEAIRRKIERAVSGASDDPERLLAKAGEVLAGLTNCAAVSATSPGETAVIRRVETVAVGLRTAMLVLLTSTGVLKSKICRLDSEITPALLESFYNVTASMLVGRPLCDVNISTMQTLAASAGENAFAMLPLMAGAAELAREASLCDVRLEGQQNLLSYRELEENAYELMEFLRRGEPLFSMLTARSKGSVKLFIGKENQYKQLHQSSVILANYSVNDQEGGSIGVIGPTRLDYAKLIPSVKYLTDLVGRILTSALE